MKTLLFAVGALGILYLAAPGHSAPAPSANLAATALASSVGAASPANQALFTKLTETVGVAIEKNDMKALGEFMTHDYTHYSPSNTAGHKAEELAYVAMWPTTTVKLVEAVQVSRVGNMAVTVSQDLYPSTDGDGKTVSNTVQHMIAWTLNNGKWQMAIVQSKKMPA